MNKIHILNPPSEQAVTQTYGPGHAVSAFVLHISIACAAKGAKKFSFLSEQVTDLQVTVSELELLSCTNLFINMELFSDSSGNQYALKVNEFEHVSKDVCHCVSIPSLLRLISKTVLFMTGNTVIFELFDHVRKCQSKIGPLFYESEPLNVTKTHDASPLEAKPTLMTTRHFKLVYGDFEIDYAAASNVAVEVRGRLNDDTVQRYANSDTKISLGVRYYQTELISDPQAVFECDFQTMARTMTDSSLCVVDPHDFTEGRTYKTFVFLEFWDVNTDKTNSILVFNPDGSVTEHESFIAPNF